jgi:hypothetical protein
MEDVPRCERCDYDLAMHGDVCSPWLLKWNHHERMIWHRVVRERNEARAVLRDLEWSGSVKPGDPLFRSCPSCGISGHPGAPHADDCRLAKVLGVQP